MGTRRLEDDEAKESAAASEENPLKVDPKLRAKRVALRLQFSANRSSCASATECALFVHTEQPHWISHSDFPLFLGRRLIQISECKRLLLGAKTSLTRAASVDMMCVDIEMPR